MDDRLRGGRRIRERLDGDAADGPWASTMHTVVPRGFGASARISHAAGRRYGEPPLGFLGEAPSTIVVRPIAPVAHLGWDDDEVTP